jgi:hypothetical protein
MADDLKTNWTNPPVPTPDLSGSGVTQRGGDPQIDTTGTSGLKPMWDNPPVPGMDAKETANSVSGLPGTPNRWEPSGTPPPPPDLTQRSPGTIDEK